MVVLADIGVHRVDGRIAARVVRVGLDGIEQLGAQGIVVGLVLQTFLGGLYLQHVDRQLVLQRVDNAAAVARITVIDHQRLAGTTDRSLGFRLCVVRTAGEQ